VNTITTSGMASASSTANGALAATALEKRFGSTHALRGIDVEIARGEVVAIMGPSGSGKSTLLHCLAGVVQPDGGEVRLGDTVISELNERERSRLRLTRFGFVFQYGQLLPELSAEDNVALPLMLAGTSRREALVQARDWLPRLGLDGLGARLPGELSGGQAQRVAVARALASRPEILFADEPTGSLDTLAGEQVMRATLDLARELNSTVIIVTHDARVAAYADRNILVRDGNVSGAARP